MPDGPFNLAVETTVRIGSVTLGRGDEVLATVELPDPHAPPRRAVDLMPTIAAMMREHGAGAPQLGEMYVSIGPGSFTGLRIAVATGKMLARVLGVKLVAVPTLDVVAQNAGDADAASVLVCLNMKRETVYGGVFGREGGAWVRRGEARLATVGELLEQAPRPTVVIGDPPAALPADAPDVTPLPAASARARSEAVWRLGRAAASRGAYTEPARLLPLYVRPPEAVEIWNKRAKAAAK